MGYDGVLIHGTSEGEFRVNNTAGGGLTAPLRGASRPNPGLSIGNIPHCILLLREYNAHIHNGGRFMMITRISPFTGLMHTRDINVTQQQLDFWQTSTVPIQRALPHLTPDEREFIMTGITADEWDNAFGEEA